MMGVDVVLDIGPDAIASGYGDGGRFEHL